MKIAVIEIYSHHVFVVTVMKIFRRLGHEVTLFVSSDVAEKLSGLIDDDVNLHSASPKELNIAFLYRNKRQIDCNFDLVLLNSVQGFAVLTFFFIRFEVLTIAAAGRVSEFFGGKYKVVGFESIRRLLHHNISLFAIKRLIPTFDGLIFHSQKAVDLARSHGYLKQTLVMPFALHIPSACVSERTKLCSSDEFRFVVTGSMSDTSRDFFMVLRVLERMWSNGSVEAHLILLSHSTSEYGDSVVKKLNELQDKGYPVSSYSSWISEEEYMRVCESSDLLIAPIKYEHYGAGEISSVEVEVIRYGRPAAFPCWYHLNDIDESGCIFYSSEEDLLRLLLKFTDDADFRQQVSRGAQKYAGQSAIDIVASSMDSFLKGVCDVEAVKNDRKSE